MPSKRILVALVAVAACVAGAFYFAPNGGEAEPSPKKGLRYKPYETVDTGGVMFAFMGLKPWKDPTSLAEVQAAFDRIGYRIAERIEGDLAKNPSAEAAVKYMLAQASLLLYEGDAIKAYEVLCNARRRAIASDPVSAQWLYTIIFYQGVAGLRRGENENCVECRGEGSCLFPLQASAVHDQPAGSRLALRHFTEYLEQFPDDEGARWLLNLAAMTLGEHPGQLPSRQVLRLDGFGRELDIGRFRDVAAVVGVKRLNTAGGAIMDDFDNDGLLDIVISAWDAGQGMAYYRNKGDGTFEDCTARAGIRDQVAGANIVQADFDNDGYLDIFVTRGGWLPYPVRPTLLRNLGNGSFRDVTREAGLMYAGNSLAATWADYDNDGFVDLFVCCDFGPNKLFRNKGDGTFEEVAARAGVEGVQKTCKGAQWIDYDNDGYPDLFATYLDATPQLFHNNRDGTFSDVTSIMGITGPRMGFACWAFDYDNDGWLDILATSYDRSLSDLVRDLQGRSPSRGREVTRLWRNVAGKEFRDVSKEAGVAGVFATMGSNFADFDNDGYLDFYLGTGDPNLETLVPNRMFKNVEGKRFADITATSGTGLLQKGHGCSCGDWDRDGNVDIFMEVGGATPGDRFHNALLQNPGQGNNWLTVKLLGTKTNRAAIGARLKIVTAGQKPLVVHRHFGTGGSWGANPLQQTVGVDRAKTIATLEIRWPTSKTIQTFHDIEVNQAIEITENGKTYRKLNWNRLPSPLSASKF